MLAYEIKQVAAGKPTPVSEMGFRYWLNALIYGGGLGLFGDFLFADQNRYGGSMAKTLAGPVISFLDDSIQLTIGQRVTICILENIKMGKEFVNFIQRYTSGSTLSVYDYI